MADSCQATSKLRTQTTPKLHTPRTLPGLVGPPGPVGHGPLTGQGQMLDFHLPCPRQIAPDPIPEAHRFPFSHRCDVPNTVIMNRLPEITRQINALDSPYAPDRNGVAGISGLVTYVIPINYILFIASFLIGGISLVGLVIAYAVRTSDADDYVNSHFSYQIRTFWIFFTVMAIQLVLLTVVVLIDRPSDMALIGSIAIVILIAIGMNVWYVFRSAVGLKALSRSESLEV